MDKELTVETLLKHGKRFGADGVMETGIEAGLSLSKLVRLQEGLDKIEEGRDRGRTFSQYKKPRQTAEKRVKKLLGIEEEEDA